MRRTEVEVVQSDGREAVQTTEYVPAELNLESTGYFSAGYKRRYPTERQKSKVVMLGSSRHVIEIVPSAKYGYPNSDDLDFHRAFLRICDERATLQKRQYGNETTLHPELPDVLPFSTREIIRYAGRMESARERQAVRDWIKRCTFTGIEGGLYRAETKKRESEFGGPLFSRYILVGERLPDGTVAATNYVWPNMWFRSNYFFRYFRPVDLAFHRRLQKAIAKTLYPILDTGWYAAQGGAYTKRYTDLCTILFIPAYKSISLVKRQLDPSHEELQEEQFLGSWEYVIDKEGKWTGVIRWWPGKKWFYDQEERKQSREGGALPEDILPLLPGLPFGETTGAPSTESACFQDGSVSEVHVERVKGFYAQLGQTKISRQKMEGGIKILADLEAQGFTREEVDLGLGWILKRRENLGRKVYSLRLLPEVIGQALEEASLEKKRDGKQRKDQEQQLALFQQTQDAEKLYQSLSTAEQAVLRGRAIENLLQQGVKREFLLESLIKNEAYCLLKAEIIPQEGN